MLRRCQRRNDSSNVSSLLAPADLQDFQTEAVRIKPKRHVTNRSRKLHEMHCESCYCRGPIVMPLLHLGPKHRDASPSAPTQWDRGITSHRKPCRANVRRITTTKPVPCTRAESSYHSDDGPDIESAELVVSSRSDNDDSQQLKSTVVEAAVSQDDFRQVSDFRKDKYFECHSVQDATQDPSHKCVHKFVVNERLMLEPVTCNLFGVSCCEVCGKLMEDYKRQVTTPRLPGARMPVDASSRSFCKRDLAPPRLNIGSGEEMIEIKVPERVGRECFRGDGGFKYKKCRCTGNSYALRFQKRLL